MTKLSHCRNEAKYCYENLETGSVQYAYPDETNQNEIVRDDDEMDICTTPPPPSIIDEPSNIVESRSFGKCSNIYVLATVRLRILVHSIFYLQFPSRQTGMQQKSHSLKNKIQR